MNPKKFILPRESCAGRKTRMIPDANQWGNSHTVLPGAETVVVQGWGQSHLDQDGVVSQTLALCLSINLVLGSVHDH